MRGLLIVSGAWNRYLDVNQEAHSREVGTVIFRGFSLHPCDAMSYNDRYLTVSEGCNIRFAFTTRILQMTISLIEPDPNHVIVWSVDPCPPARPSPHGILVQCYTDWDGRGQLRDQRLFSLDFQIAFFDKRIWGPRIEQFGNLDVEVMEEIDALTEIHETLTQEKGQHPNDCLRLLEIPLEDQLEIPIEEKSEVTQ